MRHCMQRDPLRRPRMSDVLTRLKALLATLPED